MCTKLCPLETCSLLYGHSTVCVTMCVPTLYALSFVVEQLDTRRPAFDPCDRSIGDRCESQRNGTAVPSLRVARASAVGFVQMAVRD
jgi:hypothetical protein